MAHNLLVVRRCRTGALGRESRRHERNQLDEQDQRRKHPPRRPLRRILPNSLFRDMRQNGYECSQILALATELIDLVTREMTA